jgi:hypothetical protein
MCSDWATVARSTNSEHKNQKITCCRYSRWNRVDNIGILVLNSRPIWTHYFLVLVFWICVTQQSPNLNTLFSGSCVLNLCSLKQSPNLNTLFSGSWVLNLCYSTVNLYCQRDFISNTYISVILISIPPEKKIENKITMLISYNIYSDMHNRICGVIVSVIVSNAIDGGFEARAGQTKDYKICIGCFSVMQTVFINMLCHQQICWARNLLLNECFNLTLWKINVQEEIVFEDTKGVIRIHKSTNDRLAHWNNNPRIDMSPHSVTLF